MEDRTSGHSLLLIGLRLCPRLLAQGSGGADVDPGVGDGDDGCVGVGGDPGGDVERGWEEVVTPSH